MFVQFLGAEVLGFISLKTRRVNLFLLFIGGFQFLTGCAMQVGSTKYRPFEDTLYTFKSSKEVIGTLWISLIQI